jgi:hypothetical protein
VPQRVVEQVGQHLVQPLGVGVDDQARLDVGDHPLRGPGGARDVVDEGSEVEALAVQRHLAGLQPRQVQQGAHQPGEPAGLRQRGLERLRVGLRDAVGEVLQQRLQGGERRAQLVADVGHQVATLLVDPGEVGRHGVEGPGQLAHLVARRRPHATSWSPRAMRLAAAAISRRGDVVPRASSCTVASETSTPSGTVTRPGRPARMPSSSAATVTATDPTTTRPSLTLMLGTGSSSLTVRRFRHGVADADDGAHHVLAELAAQRRDVAVDRAGGAAGVAPAPDVGQQLLAAEHGARARRQPGEQVELGRRQVHGCPDRATRRVTGSSSTSPARSGARSSGRRDARRSRASTRADSSRRLNGLTT